MSNKYVNGGIKLFSWGFNVFLALTLIATAMILVGWCIIWAFVSAISN